MLPGSVDPVPAGFFAGEQGLAPYALRGMESRGRRHPEPPHPFRSPFQRDRDRIIHCRAFRRLDGKTQVFLGGTGDHYRTRLTHTIEVAAIARTLARGLRLNEDLTEAVALAHDLGHTPFGHMGERVLDGELRRVSAEGFDHNGQSLRVVDFLERKYPGINGLNLSWEVRAGLMKHRTPESELDGVRIGTRIGLEAQAAHIADDVAYCTHDLDDGLESGLLTLESLAGVTLWEEARNAAVRQGGKPDAEYFPSFVVRCLIDMLVADILEASAVSLAAAGRDGAIGFSARVQPLAGELRDALFRKLYRHPDVMAVNQKVGEIVSALFRHFLEHPEDLGDTARRRAGSGPDAVGRAAADYLAGMTDRYALQLARKFTGLA